MIMVSVVRQRMVIFAVRQRMVIFVIRQERIGMEGVYEENSIG
mgnify:FL=1